MNLKTNPITMAIELKTKLTGLFYLLCSQQVSSEIDWCALPCGSEPNTLCKYSPQENAGDCKNIKTATTDVMREELLDLHNTYRDKIANGEIGEKGVTWPHAGDMRQMSWDNNLEKLALRWAQQCSWSPPHDKCRRTPEFEYNGQNKAYTSTTPGFHYVNESFKGWVSEISLTTPDIVDSYAFGIWGHFSQIIWAETYKLGCAIVQADKEGIKPTTIVMCNYGPGGNFRGRKTYSRGDSACSACPSGTQCNVDSVYKHLCALPPAPTQPGGGDKPIPTRSNCSSELRIFETTPKESVGMLAVFIYLIIET